MRTIFRSAAGLALALGLCAVAQAQMRGRPFTRISTAAPAGVRVVRSGQLRTNVRQLGGRVIVVGQPGLFPFDPFSFDTFPVPGFGFDFVHLAAVTRNFKVSDLSVLSTAQRLALARRLSPAFPFAAPFFSQPAEFVILQQPPVVLVQPGVAAEEVVEPESRATSTPPRQAAETPRPPEPRDVGEFVLVRRDGRVLFAVAFSAEGNALIYITREGVRRSLPLADLDVEATVRMNEERGTTLRLPV